MKITKLTLVGYKRLLLNNIKEFVYNPAAPCQIILGRNGSGKSSILSELTPLPAVTANFVKGGYKTIELESRGIKYILSSTFTSGSKHSFLKDGEELNPGGTGSVQKELVKQEFRVTPELHELLIGQTKFTSMSPAKRREWITMLSDTDLTYAINTYNKLKSRARDSVGALKHVTNRVANETNKLLAIENAKELGDRVKELREELTLLMENRTVNLPSYTQVRTTLENNLNDLEQISREILHCDLRAPHGFTFTQEQDVHDVLNKIKTDLSVTESLLLKSSEEHEELEKLFETIKDYSAESLNDLKEQSESLGKDIDSLRSNVKTFVIENPEDKVYDSVEAIPTLMDIMTTIDDNSERLYTRYLLNDKRDRSKEVQMEIERCNNQISNMESKIDHILTAKETGCPNCGFVWKPGVSEGDLEQLRSAIARANENKDKYKKELEELTTYIESAEQWANNYRQFTTLVNNYPRLKQLWDYIVEKECVVNNPKANTPLLSIWEKDLETARDIEQKRKEKQRLDAALNQSQTNKDSEHLSNRYTRLEDDISSLTVKLQGLKNDLNRVGDYERKISRVLDLSVKAQGLSEEIARDRDLLVNIVRNDCIGSTIQQQQSSLAFMEQKLNEKTTLEGIISDLQKSSNELAVDSEAYKLLVDCLSPHDGLIAEQLTGFINCLVEQMNEIIGHIWTYDLFVLACGIESEELDYKFPLQVRTPSNQVPDIGKASDGQMEIIDFAFKLVVMLYLDLTDYPLYLDELGRACDEQHRVNIMNYIKMVVDARRYSQLFYISHFASSHGAMSSAEILVLDSANISVPAGHNKHATLG